MIKVLLLLSCLIPAKLFSQITIAPTTTMACDDYYRFVNFTVTAGTAPYSFTVETPSCNTTFTATSLTANGYFQVFCQGVYTLTVYDATSSFSASVTHTVVYETFVDAGISGDAYNDTICLGIISYLFASGVPGNVINPITWNTGETTPFIIVSPTVTTSYSYTGVSSYPMMTKTCTAIGTMTLVVVTCDNGVGIKDLTDIDYKIYPNPIKDKLYLEFEQSAIKLKITNALGQTVFVLNEPLPEQEIDMSFLSSGVYFFGFENKQGQKVMKIIKE
jgi:hypothetical protein